MNSSVPSITSKERPPEKTISKADATLAQLNSPTKAAVHKALQFNLQLV
jgi:hypothetical protein